MKRYLFTLFMLILLPFQAIAFLDENEETRSSATIPNDFQDDGRYDAYKGVKPVIPMDTADPSYDMWKIPREDLSKGREPGPINVQRYPGGMGFMGIPTYFRLPIALTPEDL